MCSTDVSEEDISNGNLNDSYGSYDGRKDIFQKASNIVPVMIRHVIQSDDEFYLWGMNVHIVTFLGIVRNDEKTSTRLTYEIEDETGNIKAVRWMNPMDKSESTITLNIYVRVYGHIRVQNEIKYVLVLKIVPLTDLNELTSHLLEVTTNMLKAEKAFIVDKDKAKPKSHEYFGLNADQMLVYNAIQHQNHTENGISRDKIVSEMPNSILPFIDDIIDFLTCEGHIYTTVTDDYFKTT